MTTTLSPAERKALKARAHALSPVVMIGDAGLTPGVLAEIERSLNSHELIKIRVAGDDRDQRVTLLAEICAASGAAAVQHIGKVLVIWRKSAKAEKPKAEPKRRARPASKATKVAKVAKPAKPAPRQRERGAPDGRRPRPTTRKSTSFSR